MVSRLSGATPTRAAIAFRSSVPSSGSAARSVSESTGPTPGALWSSASRSRQIELCCTSAAIRREVGVRPAKFAGQVRDVRREALLDARPTRDEHLLQATLLGREHLDQLAAPGEECLEFLMLRIGQRSR